MMHARSDKVKRRKKGQQLCITVAGLGYGRKIRWGDTHHTRFILLESHAHAWVTFAHPPNERWLLFNSPFPLHLYSRHGSSQSLEEVTQLFYRNCKSIKNNILHLCPKRVFCRPARANAGQVTRLLVESESRTHNRPNIHVAPA